MSRNKLYSLSKQGVYSHIKKPKLSISQRIMELCGLEVIDSKTPKYFSDEQLISWRNGLNGFISFSKEILNVELQEYQIEIVTKMFDNRHSVSICGRRSGKTFLCALYVLWRAIINPSEKICLISPSYESSLIIFRQVLEFVARSQELRWDISRDTADELEFRNKSNIKSLSAQSLAIRGRENSIVVIDEVSSLENEEGVMASISPSLASRKGSQLILISTPRARMGILWEAWNSPLYAKSKYPSTANKFLDLEWLELEKQKLPSEIFQMEYEAEWCDATDMFFPSKLINKCIKSYDFVQSPSYDRLYYAGIDIGRLHDSSVLCIVSNNNGEMRVENIIILNNIPFQNQIQRFMRIFDIYRVQQVMIEYAGLSMPVVEQLETEWHKSKIKRFIPTIRTKEENFTKLLNAMEKGNLTIPKHEALLTEMRNFQYIHTARGIKLGHRNPSHHDDCLDALQMAVNLIIKPIYRPYITFGSRT